MFLVQKRHLSIPEFYLKTQKIDKNYEKKRIKMVSCKIEVNKRN